MTDECQRQAIQRGSHLGYRLPTFRVMTVAVLDVVQRGTQVADLGRHSVRDQFLRPTADRQWLTAPGAMRHAVQRNPNWPAVGIFGHRNMRRINWLGVSRCRLIKWTALICMSKNSTL